jgi:hypothetical protein
MIKYSHILIRVLQIVKIIFACMARGPALSVSHASHKKARLRFRWALNFDMQRILVRTI